MKLVAESVSKYHPDKICDQISDLIVDECLKQDPNSRVAIETAGGHGQIYLVGEITTKANIDYKKVVKDYYRKLTGKEIDVITNIVKQSPDIAQGVDKGGAGDQGFMYGYACNETPEKMPIEMSLCRKILALFKTDAKSQVVLEKKDNKFKLSNVVLSVQGKEKQELEDYLKQILPYSDYKMYCNNTGKFDIGGFDADSGCTGRKIVVDQYGSRVPVGGGSLNSKDGTKVDRSGAYMARFIALNKLKQYNAKEVLVRLAYVIGGKYPLLQEAIIKTKDNRNKIDNCKEFDCRPNAIIERFNLKRPIYLDLAQNGHFGRKELPWEKIL